jgi:hypothetical protein
LIVGDGDIASKIIDREGFCFFASGVSFSGETREEEYEREYRLLLEQPKDLRLVYPSSMSVFYAHNRYTQHKIAMELMIHRLFPKWTILRMGNITWGNNPHTLINFFKGQKARGEKLDIQDTYRYIITEEEFHHYLALIPDWNCEMNIGRRMKVEDIVKEYVDR